MSSINRATVDSPNFAAPLARRIRPQSVSAELNQLEGQPTTVVLRRANEKDRSKELSKEALIAVFRAYLRTGDLNTANKVFLVLMDRVSGAIANRLVRWRSISVRHQEDVRQTIILSLYEYMSSQEAGEELWECNFKTSFDLRMLNILGKITRSSEPAISVSQLERDDVTEDKFDVVDVNAEADFDSIDVKEALRHLDRIDPRLGKVFYLKFFAELPEGEISSLMEVSERTVRNWIVTSRKELRSYFAEQ